MLTKSVIMFAFAAPLEIAGCFAFWSWPRKSASPWIAVAGVLSLVGFAIVLTRI